jgi:hypothetical protein
MAAFIRQQASVGDSSIRALVMGGDVDNAAFADVSKTTLTMSDLIKVDGIYSSEYTEKFPTISRGRRTLASRSSNPRTLTFTFACGDPSGAEQSRIKAFFAYNRMITYVDTERSIPAMGIWVISVDDSFFDGADGIVITAQAQDDELSTRLTTSLYNSGSITSWPTISVNFTNNASTDASIQLTLATAASTAQHWNDATITLKSTSTDATAAGKVVIRTIATTGIMATYDSADEVIMGPIQTDAASDQKFFLIPHGVTTTITATATGIPMSVAFTVGISAFYTAPFGMYSDDFSIDG